MASAGTAAAPAAENHSGNTKFADKLPEEINEMKIKDEKVLCLSWIVSVLQHLFIYSYITFKNFNLYFIYLLTVLFIFVRKWKQLWWMAMELKLATLL